MSGISGVLMRDGESVSSDALEKMQHALSWWNPDTSAQWQEGSVGLVHAMLWNTPESKLEKLPCIESHLTITMDARLDERDTLARLLKLSDRPISKITDSELILAAYHKWGEECPRHLVGDFSFAIWDKRKQHLFCARDHVGIKQFYYKLTDSIYIFSNDLKSLTKHPTVSLNINDKAVANFLVNHQLNSPTLTFFGDIEKLPPAHSLTISSGGVKKACYWRLEDAPRVKLKSIDAYAVKLRELLEQAVHDRIRSDYSITSHLSGGLDSSTIAVIAARKLKQKGERLLAFNWLHEPGKDDDPEHYEWSNSRDIAIAEDIDHHYVMLTAKDIYQNMMKRTIFYGDTSTFWYEYPVRKAAGARQSRTLLSGWGGDEFASYHGQACYADLFLQGKIIKVFRELGHIPNGLNRSKLRQIVGGLYHHIFLPIMPATLFQFMPKTKSYKAQGTSLVNDWFLPQVMEEKKKPRLLSAQVKPTKKSDMMAHWKNGHIQGRIDSWASASISSKLEYMYPLLDKRVLEFVVGVPAECFVRDRKWRCLFRDAAKGLIPEKILWSNSKQEDNRVQKLLLNCVSAWKNILKLTPTIASETDYINKQKVFQIIEDMASETISIESILLFQQVNTSLELALSTRDDGEPNKD